MKLFENVISRVVSRLFIIHAPQDPLVDWRRSAYPIDFWQPLSQNPKIPLSWPSRCGFSRQYCSKLLYFIGSLGTLINSICGWLISDDFSCQKKSMKSWKICNQIKCPESGVSLSNSKKSHLSVQTLVTSRISGVWRWDFDRNRISFWNVHFWGFFLCL